MVYSVFFTDYAAVHSMADPRKKDSVEPEYRSVTTETHLGFMPIVIEAVKLTSFIS